MSKRIQTKNSIFNSIIFLSFLFLVNVVNASNTFIINETAPFYISTDYWSTVPVGGDTIFISSSRTKGLKFLDLTGEDSNPIVVINSGGQVNIDDEDSEVAISFQDCKYIKITGDGHPGYKYGFVLSASNCGLDFSELSSDCEAEFIKISHDGFYGIMAKKNYGGNPPSPAPVFSNLIIHDCFIENVTAGMYLGETTSPGMEFKHVRVYNNIVRNTGREAIQIANMVEDIEVYNNTLLNAGTDEELWQGNILQIGDNSVAEVYNNILQGGESYGIISFGMGNNHYYNNFISSCKGVFIDDRIYTLEDSLIVVSRNYFSDIENDENEIIRNMNGENYLVFEDNVYDDVEALFYRNYYSSYTNYELSNNTVAEIDTIVFTNVGENDYSLASSNPEAYMSMGAPGGPEYFEYEEEVDDEVVDATESFQIVLNSEMIVDEVEGGSYWSADYLVDEQEMTPENDSTPESQSWKPYWNMNNGPYHVYFDLGSEYTITNISLHDMSSVANLEVSIGEPENWNSLFIEPCDAYKTWKEHDVEVTTRYIRLSMNESVYAAVNEIAVYGYLSEEDTITDENTIADQNTVSDEEDVVEEITVDETTTVEESTTSEQIVLNSSMIVDEVEGESYWSADYLVDEQEMTPENASSPTSQSWKPYWNMDYGPYHVYIDLGQEYNLTNISLHDMQNSKNLVVSIGEPGSWDSLFTEPCDAYKTWKEHDVDVTTRYIRLSMNESVYAAVNEIIIYGYSDAEADTVSYAEKSETIYEEQSSAESTDVVLSDPIIEDYEQDLYICQNPVASNVQLNMPQELSDDFTIEIFSLNGMKVYSQKYVQAFSSKLNINISEKYLKTGMYILRYTNQTGISKSMKFLKNSY